MFPSLYFVFFSVYFNFLKKNCFSLCVSSVYREKMKYDCPPAYSYSPRNNIQRLIIEDLALKNLSLTRKRITAPISFKCYLYGDNLHLFSTDDAHSSSDSRAVLHELQVERCLLLRSVLLPSRDDTEGQDELPRSQKHRRMRTKSRSTAMRHTVLLPPGCALQLNMVNMHRSVTLSDMIATISSDALSSR